MRELGQIMQDRRTIAGGETVRTGEEDIDEEIGSGRSDKDFGYFSSWFRRGQVKNARNLRSFREVVSIREVTALIHYVTERGMDPDGKIVCPLHRALVHYKQANALEERISSTNEILVGYSQLCRITYSEHSINGRTLRDSTLSAWYMKSIILWGLIFIFCALSIHYVEYRSHDFVDGTVLQGWRAMLAFIGKTGSIQIVPLFYGGLGACIYLLRSLSKKAANGTFDARKLQGSGARIFLGAIFGFIVVNLLFHTPESGTRIASNLGLEDLQQNAVAFFCGLGVKAIYGIFERSVEFVHDKVVKFGT
ncbi:MAG: hypothetical protein OYH76_23205 [Defluviicoccus sp.]|nr:hypothetical protein [Defluviicoccus sp.]MDE0278813.1 hypothetical protein [Defluviicoccus sp.]